MVMTESLACGTPIVVPSTCDIVEEDVVMDGKNAIVYPAPTEEAIREAVLRAMEARFDRAAVRRTVAGMAWSSVSAVYEKLFSALARSSVSSGCEGIRRHANL
jgi:glycosyltransferase involved in cell wall biosynthesis